MPSFILFKVRLCMCRRRSTVTSSFNRDFFYLFLSDILSRLKHETRQVKNEWGHTSTCLICPYGVQRFKFTCECFGKRVGVLVMCGCFGNLWVFW